MIKTLITKELLFEKWHWDKIFCCFAPCDENDAKVGIWWQDVHRRWDLNIITNADTDREKCLRFVGIEYMEDIADCLRMCGLNELADKLINDKI